MRNAVSSGQITPTSWLSFPPGSSSPGYLTNVNGTLFFTADDGSAGTELWLISNVDDPPVADPGVAGPGVTLPPVEPPEYDEAAAGTYIAEQLTAFRDGAMNPAQARRYDPLMSPQSIALTDEDIRNLAVRPAWVPSGLEIPIDPPGSR